MKTPSILIGSTPEQFINDTGVENITNLMIDVRGCHCTASFKLLKEFKQTLMDGEIYEALAEFQKLEQQHELEIPVLIPTF